MDDSSPVVPSPGVAISRYRLEEKIGEGGNGIVFRAEDTSLSRTVALKFLRAEDSDDDRKARLIREAEAASGLSHPNICVVHEVDEGPTGPFIVMEFLEGETVRDKVKRAPLELSEALRIAIQAAEGLKAAHENGLVHRDVKSANLIVTPSGQVKVMDFGLVQLADRTRLTKSGARLGTPAYMSPEQTLGEETDSRSDIWALGVLLYEMISGRMPFKGDIDAAVAYAIVNRSPDPLTSLRRGLPLDIDFVLEKALAKDPDERYQYLDDVIVDLMSLLETAETGEPSARPAAQRPSYWAFWRKPPHRRDTSRGRITTRRQRAERARWAALGVTVLVLALLAVAFVLLPPSLQPDRAPHVAVLPISAAGGEGDFQIYADGLMEAVTMRLSQFERSDQDLLVVSPAEVRRREVSSPAEALAKFGANFAVEGSLQSQGDRVRLVLTLVDTRTLNQVDSTVIEDRRANSLNLQDGAVAKLATLLNLNISPEHVQEYAELSPAAPGAHEYFIQGRGYLQRNDQLDQIESAIKLFERAIDTDETYALAYASLGEAYWFKYMRTKEIQWVDLAKEYCERAVELNGQVPLVHVALGRVHQGAGEYEAAVQDFNRALALDPRSADAFSGLAGAYSSLGQSKEAESTFQTAIRLRPADWNVHKELGMFFYRHGEYRKSIGQFEEVVRLTPDNALGYTNLGVLYYRLGENDKSERYLERSIQIEPRPTALSNLAQLMMRTGRPREAAEQWERAVAMQPRNRNLWSNLAGARRRTGDEAGALEAFGNAIELAEDSLGVNPNDPDLLASLAHYFASIDEPQRAEEIVDQTLGHKPDNPNLLILLAETSERIGQREQALSLAREAVDRGYRVETMASDWLLSELVSDPRYGFRSSVATGASTSSR